MMWGAFWGTGKSRIVKASRQEGGRGGVAARGFQILDEELDIFIQDNAPIHTAEAITDWMDERGVSRMK